MSGAANPFKTAAGAVSNVAIARTVGGAGWVPINLTTASGGSPLGILPIDPANTGNFYYAYACNEANKTFELDAMLESTKYQPKGVNTADGGDGTDGAAGAYTVYEVGTSLTL